MKFLDIISSSMLESGLTQSSFASMLNIGGASVSRWFNDGSIPTKMRVLEIAKKLNLSEEKRRELIKVADSERSEMNKNKKKKASKSEGGIQKTLPVPKNLEKLIKVQSEQIKHLETQLQSLHLSNKQLRTEIEGIRSIVGENPTKKKRSRQQQEMIDKILSDGDKVVSENRKNINKKKA